MLADMPELPPAARVHARVWGLVLSRYGLWQFDLAANQLLQETVDSGDMGVVNGVQGSLQSLFQVRLFAGGWRDRRRGWGLADGRPSSSLTMVSCPAPSHSAAPAAADACLPGGHRCVRPQPLCVAHGRFLRCCVGGGASVHKFCAALELRARRRRAP